MIIKKLGSIRNTIIGFMAILLCFVWIFAANPVLAKVNPVADILVFSTECAGGRFGNGTCPQGQDPAPTALINGWTNVTTAMDATGTGLRIDIGGGNNTFNDLSGLDPGTLTPGTVVNIYHRAQPYNTKFTFHTDGTEANPIIINGVTNASGIRPQINCEGAITQNPQDGNATWTQPYGCWVLTYSRDGGVYQDPVEWMEFRNLEMYGAVGGATYDNGAGVYVGGTSNIRLNESRFIKFKGNIFRNSDNGIFTSSVFPNADIWIQGNKFIDNGTPGSYLHHNLYFQAVASRPFNNIVEGNYFGKLIDGAIGTGSLKHRGTDLIFRYNTVACFSRCLDLVELQDELPDYVYTNFSAQEILDRYRTSYVYGNQFWLDSSRTGISGSAYGIHVGMDTGTAAADDQLYSNSTPVAEGEVMARGVGSPVYFYNNSLYFNNPTEYYQSIFDLDSGSAGDSRHFGSVVAANNIIHFDDTSAPSQAFGSHGRSTGNITYVAANTAYIPGTAAEFLYEGRDLQTLDDPEIALVGGTGVTFNQSKAGLDPLFTDVSNSIIELINLKPQAGSSAIGAALALPAPMTNFPVLGQPILPSLGGGVESRATTSDLGAYE